MSFCSCLIVFLVSLISFHPNAAQAAVSGYVFDGNSNPVGGATVTFTNESNAGETYDAITSTTGSYAIDIVTSVEELQVNSFTLGQNFPNPFNPVTTIPFSLERNGHVSIIVYNVSGQKVTTLVDDYMHAGSHVASWNGYASDGSHVASGIYFYRLTSGDMSLTGKMTLLDGGSGSGTSGYSGTATQIAKTASITYRVSITGDDIETYEETGITLSDGATLDFTVTRKASEPVEGQYTMPLNIKQTGQFFDFSSGTSVEALSAMNSWDIAFENQSMGLGIDLNFGKASRGMNTGETDFDAVTLPEDISDDEFILEAPWSDTSAVVFDGWYTMEQMGVIESKKEVHIIASAGDDGTDYYKVQLTGYSDGTYSFCYAALPDGERVDASVAKGGDTNWKYYSFASQAEVDYEPAADSWDLYFGATYFLMGEMGYMAVGKIIPNFDNDVKMAVAADIALEDFTLDDWPEQLKVMYEVADWYATDGMPPTYSYPVQTFLVKTTESKYAAFQILSYKSAGVTGFPTFNFKYNWEE